MWNQTKKFLNNNIVSSLDSVGDKIFGSYYIITKQVWADTNKPGKKITGLLTAATKYNTDYSSKLYALDTEDSYSYNAYRELILAPEEKLRVSRHNNIKAIKSNPSFDLSVPMGNEYVPYPLIKYVSGATNTSSKIKNKHGQEYTLYIIQDTPAKNKYRLRSGSENNYMWAIYINEANGNVYFPEQKKLSPTITREFSFKDFTTVKDHQHKHESPAYYFYLRILLTILQLPSKLISWVTYTIPVFLFRLGSIITRVILPLPIMLLNTLARVLSHIFSNLLNSFSLKEGWKGVKEGWNSSLDFNHKLFSQGILGYLNKEVLHYDTLEKDLKEAQDHTSDFKPSFWKIGLGELINVPWHLTKFLLSTLCSVGLALNAILWATVHMALSCIVIPKDRNYHRAFAKSLISNTFKKISANYKGEDFSDLAEEKKENSVSPAPVRDPVQAALNENSSLKYDWNVIKETANYIKGDHKNKNTLPTLPSSSISEAQPGFTKPTETPASPNKSASSSPEL